MPIDTFLLFAKIVRGAVNLPKHRPRVRPADLRFTGPTDKSTPLKGVRPGDEIADLSDVAKRQRERNRKRPRSI